MLCPHCNGSGKLTNENSTVGLLIMARRKYLGMTQEQLAAKVQKSRTQVTNIESGRSDLPIKTLAAFATALKCTMRDLVPGGKDD